jgi:hypothetical protein
MKIRFNGKMENCFGVSQIIFSALIPVTEGTQPKKIEPMAICCKQSGWQASGARQELWCVGIVLWIFTASTLCHSTPVLSYSDINIAYGKPASQSSTHSTATADRPVDGNANGNYWNGSVSHTSISGTNAWWQVDLGDNFNIGQIRSGTVQIVK